MILKGYKAHLNIHIQLSDAEEPSCSSKVFVKRLSPLSKTFLLSCLLRSVIFRTSCMYRILDLKSFPVKFVQKEALLLFWTGHTTVSEESTLANWFYFHFITSLM